MTATPPDSPEFICKIDLLNTQNQAASRTTYLSKSESMASKKPTHRCQFCSKPFAIQRALNHHISASKTCYKEWRKGLVRNEQPSLKRPCRNSPSMDDIFDGFDTQDVDDFVPPPPPGTPPHLTGRRVTVDNAAYPTTNMDRFVEPYPGDAGQGIRKSKTRFEKWLEIQDIEGTDPWQPFASKEEWALTRWLMNNVGQKSTDEYLKLPIVHEVVLYIKNACTHTEFY